MIKEATKRRCLGWVVSRDGLCFGFFFEDGMYEFPGESSSADHPLKTSVFA